MPIDLAAVDWLYVIVLAMLVFLSTLIGIVLAFRHVFLGALLSTLLFVAGFVFWTYYPHHLPLPTRLAGTSGRRHRRHRHQRRLLRRSHPSSRPIPSPTSPRPRRRRRPRRRSRLASGRRRCFLNSARRRAKRGAFCERGGMAA